MADLEPVAEIRSPRQVMADIGGDFRRLRDRVEGLERQVAVMVAALELADGLDAAELTPKQRTFIRRLWAAEAPEDTSAWLVDQLAALKK